MSSAPRSSKDLETNVGVGRLLQLQQGLWQHLSGARSQILQGRVGGSHSALFSSSVAQSYPTLCNLMDSSTPGFPVHHRWSSWSLLKLRSIESVMPSNHLVLCCPFLLLPSVFPSIRVFSNVSALCIRLAKVLVLQLHHQSFQGIFRADFLWDFLV